MTKLASSFELALLGKPKGSAYRWLYGALRAEILAGRLRPGARLPATRDLASQFDLARGTIVSAFDLLKSEGYVEGSVGSGTYVSRILPEELLHVARQGAQPPILAENPAPVVSRYSRSAQLFSGFENRPTRAFRCNLPALDLFPTELWTKITNRRLRRLSQRQLMGCDPSGYLPLRTAVAEYLTTSRGVQCVPEQVAILSGVQEALDLVSRVFINPGDHVCMENPGYRGAAFVFQAAGAKLSGIGVDEEGLQVSHLPPRGVRLAYVTPGHQFPLGTTMSLARRLQLLEWARKSDALILEDDYDSEFRYSGRPIPALQGLDRRAGILYTGSFNKVLFPSLRLGYLVIPPNLMQHFEAALSLTCRHAPMLEQLTLTDFIVEGHFARHLRRMRTIYAERLNVLLEESRLRLEGLLEMSSVEAGLQTAGRLRPGIKDEAIAAAAAERDVEVTPVSRYCLGKPVTEGLQLGFAAVDEREIRRGVRELAVVLERASNTRIHKG